MTYMPTILVGI